MTATTPVVLPGPDEDSGKVSSGTLAVRPDSAIFKEPDAIQPNKEAPPLPFCTPAFLDLFSTIDPTSASAKNMADGSPTIKENGSNSLIDNGKGIEMNGVISPSKSADGSSDGKLFKISTNKPHISDGKIGEGKDFDSSGTRSEHNKAIQEHPLVPKELKQNDDKEIIVLDDDDDVKANMMNEVCNIPNLNGKNEPIPRLGMIFTSYNELNNYFKQYALHVGFGVAIKKSSFTKRGVCRRLILVCSKGGTGRADAMYQARKTAKTNCEVMIYAKARADGLLHLVEVKLDHNHPVNPSTAKFMRCYKRMPNSTGDEVAQSSKDNNIQLCEIDLSNAKEIGKLKLGDGDSEAIHQFFASMQNNNPNFLYLVDLDQHGRLRSIFWADAKARAAYQYFGDVVTLDTSCLTEKYDLPLVSLVGVNHHSNSVLLGCGLVSDETTETYIWLFTSWLTCMYGLPPSALITDECKAIQDAVTEVFPGTRHRICLSHILKKIPDKLRGLAEFKAVKKVIKKMAYDSLRTDIFEESWKTMIEEYGLESNGLESNEWLKNLYENRHLWVPVFLKNNSFWAGMSVSKRGESVTSFFDGSVYPRTSIKQFFSKLEMTSLAKFKKEMQTDADTFLKTPIIISKFYMEEQMSKIYTLNMFKKFQDELKATMYCHATPVKVEGSIFTFEIKECSYMEDGKSTESKDYEVLFNVDDNTVQCICGFFNFHGILCKHALSVFKYQQIYEIPSHYILDRWKKDYKRLHALARSSNDVVVGGESDHYNSLSMRFLHLADVAFLSEDRYQLSLKLIKEIEKSLLDDTSCRGKQPKVMCFGTHESQNAQNFPASILGFSEGRMNPNLNSVTMKRRGRPPKKGREPDLETLVRPNKEQNLLRSEIIPSEDNFLQAGPSVLHLSAQIRHGGINLMEDLNSNNLTFDKQFNLHIDQQHHMGNQQPNNLMQVQYEQQTIGNQNTLPWLYQHILQDDQMQKLPSVRGNL